MFNHVAPEIQLRSSPVPHTSSLEDFLPITIREQTNDSEALFTHAPLAHPHSHSNISFLFLSLILGLIQNTSMSYMTISAFQLHMAISLIYNMTVKWRSMAPMAEVAEMAALQTLGVLLVRKPIPE